ncbi:F-box/LRR-repeat protein 4 [Portunus trituberculatus]|uniref:F-box/LRR-repeat protein 4 n=1 Tax=Portunus trituberculatus TaxID=210409 RepID=A0A5B7E5Z9_PORTR|nr:F-box/LRR-repeat protein 4 [Portunus trituberculatus]
MSVIVGTWTWVDKQLSGILQCHCGSTMEEIPRKSWTHCVVDQYVKEVTDFSSQYGSDGSISYVANNIIGKPTLYPDYGDFSAAYCLRSYGYWWAKSDSAPQPIEDPKPLLPPSVDFIGIMLRIEFDQRGHSYYSALDAVMLVGSTHSSSGYEASGETITMQVMKMGIHKSICEEDILSGVKFLLSEENLQKLVEDEHKNPGEELTREEKADLEVCEDSLTAVDVTPSEDDTDISVEEGTKGGYFDLLPEELIMYILHKLDIRSLCHLACTCKLLQSYASDPFLYMTLNLRCLDLSWCGPYDGVNTETFMQFIHTCGHQLTVLRLNNCHFIDNYCLYMISVVCPNLIELSMANCTKVDHLGFGELKKARALARLDLTRTHINFHTLQLLLQHASHLQHLSLRGITESFAELVRECKGLKRLYLSALRTFTDHDLHLLITHAGNLTQLDIMGTRNITPEAVHRLLQFCPNLELLDVSFCEQIHYSHVHHWAVQFPHTFIMPSEEADTSQSSSAAIPGRVHKHFTREAWAAHCPISILVAMS